MKRFRYIICLILISGCVYLFNGCGNGYDNPYQQTRIEAKQATIRAKMRALNDTMAKAQQQERREESLENGQVYVGMPIKEFLDLWGVPTQTQDLGQNMTLLIYKYEGTMGIHRFYGPTNNFYFENGILTKWQKNQHAIY